MAKITLFAQIINTLDRNIFKKIVNAKGSDKYSKGINSWTHLVSMLFLHFSQSTSLREISNGLKSATGNLNHLGIKRAPCKSTLAYINQKRSWELFQEFYFQMLDVLSQRAGFKRRKLRIKTKIYLMDATIISLCLSIFDWAKYRQKKGAIKLHTILDYDSCLPVYVNMTDGKTHEVNDARLIDFPVGSVVVMDRGYFDFALFNKLNCDGVNFVTRLKSNIKYQCIKKRSIPEQFQDEIIADEVIEAYSSQIIDKYTGRLRRVVVYDSEKNVTIEFLTNNFSWTAKTISQLYKSRWLIEIFFKEIKQLMRIKTFVGTNVNAVLIQIWTAMIAIMLLKYLKQIAKYGWCLSNLVAFLRLNLFVIIELMLWLDKPFDVEDSRFIISRQLFLFY